MRLRSAITLVVLLSSVAAGVSAAPAGPGSTLVLMPFENLSQSVEGGERASELFAKALEAKGWQIADREKLATLLEQHRVRYFDSLDDEARAVLATELGAAAVVSGALYTYAEKGRNPMVALSARMVRADGTVGWGEVGGLSSEDTERALGFGRDEQAGVLLERLVTNVTRRFPEPGTESPLIRGKSKRFFTSGPTSYRAADVDPAQPHKVCVLPFENYSSTPAAARVVADVLAVRLAAASGFEIVEPAVLRAAAIKARIGTFHEISNEDLTRLAKAVGTPLFATGTIYEYRDPAAAGSASTPELQLEITVVDVQESRVIWSAQHARTGSDYTGFLLLGTVTNAVSLTDRVVAEMIEAGSRPAPRGQAAVTARGGRRVPEKHSALRGSRKGEKNEAH